MSSSRRQTSKGKAAPRTAHLLSASVAGSLKEREALAEAHGRSADDTNQLIITAESSKWRKDQVRVSLHMVARTMPSAASARPSACPSDSLARRRARPNSPRRRRRHRRH